MFIHNAADSVDMSGSNQAVTDLLGLTLVQNSLWLTDFFNELEINPNDEIRVEV